MRSPNVTTQAGAPFVTFKTILVMASPCDRQGFDRVPKTNSVRLTTPGGSLCEIRV